MASDTREPEGPSDRRVQWGLAAGAIVVVVVLALTLGGGDENEEHGGAPAAATSTTIDLDSVTNEQLETVVAEHPEVVGMRLALVVRYIREQEWARAQAHAEEAAVRAATVEDRSEALTWLGLATAMLGDAAGGEGILMQSLALDPSNRDSLYYLARVRYEELGRPDLAIEPLEALLDFEMTDDQRTLIEDTLDEVRVAAGLSTATTTTPP